METEPGSGGGSIRGGSSPVRWATQQKEIAHPAQAGEQLEKQVADIEQELSDKQKEFAPVVGDIAALDAQPSELSHQGLPKRVPIPPPRPTDLGR
jgi:hypothetical protein